MDTVRGLALKEVGGKTSGGVSKNDRLFFLLLVMDNAVKDKAFPVRKPLWILTTFGLCPEEFEQERSHGQWNRRKWCFRGGFKVILS